MALSDCWGAPFGRDAEDARDAAQTGSNENCTVMRLERCSRGARAAQQGAANTLWGTGRPGRQRQAQMGPAHSGAIICWSRQEGRAGWPRLTPGPSPAQSRRRRGVPWGGGSEKRK